MLRKCLLFYICTLRIILIDSHEPGAHRMSRPPLSALKQPSWGHCGVTFQLKISGPVTISSQNYGVNGEVYGENLSCDWAFIGAPDCIPTMKCRVFDLQRLGRDCGTEYVEVSDGSGAAQRFCGNGDDILTTIKSRTRDLYITFKSGLNPSKTLLSGFQCEVNCCHVKLRKSKFLNYSFNKSQHLEDIRCVCGLQNKEDRIVGGENVEKLNEFPWQVAIVFTGTRLPLCGGSIINDRYILTAAHCTPSGITRPDEIEVLAIVRILELLKLENAKDVKFGELGSMPVKTDDDEKTLRFKVIEIFSHPLFTLPEFDYDVALLKLEKKIDFLGPEGPIPICLPDADALRESYEGKLAVVTGWGLAHPDAGASTRILQKLEVPVLPFSTCLNGIPFLSPRQFCAGYIEGQKDSCRGDSDGFLAHKNSNNHQWMQIGIVSIGGGCAQSFLPGVYASTMELSSWIRHTATDANWCRSL